MNLYRVSTTELDVGGTIMPNPEGFLSNISGLQKRAEEFIDEQIPHELGINSRKECVFLFLDFKNAIEYYLKAPGNQYIYIYEVSIHPEDILRKCDMGLIDVIKKLVEFKASNSVIRQMCIYYWHSGSTPSSCYEYLVKKAKIENLLWEGNTIEIKKQRDRAGSIERTSLYIRCLTHLERK